MNLPSVQSFVIFLIITFLQASGYPLPSIPTPSLPSPQPTVVVLPADTASGEKAVVTKVVDGDTIDVSLNGKKEKVRLIGIDTPETVDPRRPVECFGKEASNKMKELLSNKEVQLVADPTQANRDKYNRLLRYVFRLDGLFINKYMVSEGYAYEYTYDVPYQYQQQFKATQKDAEEKGKGLWGKGVCTN